MHHGYLVNGHVKEAALALRDKLLPGSRAEVIRLDDVSTGPEQPEYK